MQQSKMGEENLKENIFELTADDYPDDLLREILHNHLEYYAVADEGRRIVLVTRTLPKSILDSLIITKFS